MNLIEILKDSDYKLTQFSEKHIADFENVVETQYIASLRGNDINKDNG